MDIHLKSEPLVAYVCVAVWFSFKHGRLVQIDLVCSGGGGPFGQVHDTGRLEAGACATSGAGATGFKQLVCSGSASEQASERAEKHGRHKMS